MPIELAVRAKMFHTLICTLALSRGEPPSGTRKHSDFAEAATIYRQEPRIEPPLGTLRTLPPEIQIHFLGRVPWTI
jgi:hypothetical protein